MCMTVWMIHLTLDVTLLKLTRKYWHYMNRTITNLSRLHNLLLKVLLQFIMVQSLHPIRC